MKAIKHSSDVVEFVTGVKEKLFICSDVHFDSLKCDKDLFKKHLDEIKSAGGQALIIGDLFDVMGCYKDPRSSRQEIDKRYVIRGRSYLDVVLEDVLAFLEPYKNNIAMIGYGNHETAIQKHRDTDLIERLVWSLSRGADKPVLSGAYAGYVIVRMQKENRKKASRKFIIAYHHGKGGNAKRSKGILYSQMDAMEYPDANLIVSGHDHNKIYDPSNVRRRLTNKRKIEIYQDSVHWLKTGSYKKSANDFGWEVQKGFSPKRLGGWFVDLEFKRVQKNKDDNAWIDCRITEAV